MRKPRHSDIYGELGRYNNPKDNSYVQLCTGFKYFYKHESPFYCEPVMNIGVEHWLHNPEIFRDLVMQICYVHQYGDQTKPLCDDIIVTHVPL